MSFYAPMTIASTSRATCLRAFSFCLLVVAFLDAPFEVMLRDEPGKTMKAALKKL